MGLGMDLAGGLATGLAMMSLWAGSAVAAGQPGATPTPIPLTEAAAPQPVGTPPSPDLSMAAYAALESRVRGGDPGAGLDRSFPGVSVTLRLAGKVVGRGTELDQPAPGEAPPTPGALARAVEAALQEADQRLPIEKDALREEAAREARQRMCISLELAGALVPYAPQLYDQADLEIQAGLEGLAARQGDRIAAIFPGMMLANNTTPGDALAAVISQVTGDATLAIRASAGAQPGKLAKDHGLTLYRFKVTHLAQPGPGQPPLFLFRGGRVARQNDLTAATLREMADGMAAHLLARKWPGDEPLGMLGVAWPAQGKYEPMRASSEEQALTAVAMGRYAELVRGRVLAGGADPRLFEASKQAEAFARSLLASVSQVNPAETKLSPTAAALVVVAALAESSEVGEPAESLSRLRARAEAVLDDAAANPGAIPAAEQSVVAWALAERAAASGDLSKADAADALVRLVFSKTPPAQLVSHMPWLGWAELALTRARGDGEVKSAPLLRDMRDQLWKHQLTPEDCGADGPDLAGGIVFTTAASPWPTASCIRPLTFAASMLGDRTLTSDAEMFKELSRLLAALRFVRQLEADEASGHMYQDAARARWGVRTSLWDQRQPPEATAMALIMVCETLESLETRAPKR